MFQKIVLCSDGSEEALQSARIAALLVKRLGAELILVNVMDLMSSVSIAPFYFAPEAVPPTEIVLEYAQRYQDNTLQDTGKVLAAAGVSYRVRAEAGHPVDAVLNAAEREKADLIVLGSRGLSAWKSLLLGSVSEGIAHHAHCPVLIVRGHTTCLQHILVASDASAGSDRATKVAMELAMAFDACLEVLNVLDVRATSSVHHTSGKPTELEQAAKLSQDAVALHTESIAGDSKVSYTRTQAIGHPAEVITRIAESSAADLIVLGSRGLGGFQRLLVGSVCDGVLHHAPCPILVVR